MDSMIWTVDGSCDVDLIIQASTHAHYHVHRFTKHSNIGDSVSLPEE